jgi:hypothetical protein
MTPANAGITETTDIAISDSKVIRNFIGFSIQNNGV